MRWVHTGDSWYGQVTDADIAAQTITAHSPKWEQYGLPPHLPPLGTQVEIRVVYRSPYWALVDEEEV